MKKFLFILLGLHLMISSNSHGFDHQHQQWDMLLKQNVTWIHNGTASTVNYSGFQKDHEQLRTYLQSLSAVFQKEFDSWAKQEQLAFLINAYNAFTIEFILTRYPKLKSIKDLGSFLSSPWKKKFFQLLGAKRHLDEIEHEMIRKPGVYNEPRIHFAVVCASIGCPALRNEAYIADKLDNQLDDSTIRFLSDKTRNRYNKSKNVLEVSKIFDWYKEDFSKGFRNMNSLEGVFAKYANVLSDDNTIRQQLRDMKIKINFLEYDWKLNDDNTSQ